MTLLLLQCLAHRVILGSFPCSNTGLWRDVSILSRLSTPLSNRDLSFGAKIDLTDLTIDSAVD